MSRKNPILPVSASISIICVLIISACSTPPPKTTADKSDAIGNSQVAVSRKDGVVGGKKTQEKAPKEKLDKLASPAQKSRQKALKAKLPESDASRNNASQIKAPENKIADKKTPNTKMTALPKPTTAPRKPAESNKLPPNKLPPNKLPPNKRPLTQATKSKPAVSEKSRRPIEKPKAEKSIAPVINSGSLTVSVQIMGQQKRTLSSTDTIIELEAVQVKGGLNKTDRAPAKVHTINMTNKVYQPGALAIAQGDSVTFYNNDPIKHNVFSPSGKNAFDLGTYGLRKSEQTTFEHPGIVKVYCNIHQEMATFISVAAKGLSKVVKEGNSVTFDNIPTGTYRVKAWHVRGTSSSTATVSANKTIHASLVIDSSKFKPTEHLNKHGKKYKKTPKLFQDEFY